MLSSDCKECKYVIWQVALGIGIRCQHKTNQKYKKSDDRLQQLPVLISNIPSCSLKKVKK